MEAGTTRNLVLAVHGSAVPGAGATIARLADSVRGRTGAPVTVGHLDHQAPSLPYVLADRPGAVVVPLLLGDGYHRTVDIPAVARSFDCAVTRGLSGEHAVALALYDRLRAAGGPADTVVVAGAGSSRPGGNDGTSRRSGNWACSCRYRSRPRTARRAPRPRPRRSRCYKPVASAGFAVATHPRPGPPHARACLGPGHLGGRGAGRRPRARARLVVARYAEAEAREAARARTAA